MAEWFSYECPYYGLSTNQLMSTGCFHFLSNVNSIEMHLGAQLSL